VPFEEEAVMSLYNVAWISAPRGRVRSSISSVGNIFILKANCSEHSKLYRINFLVCSTAFFGNTFLFSI